MGKHVVVPIAGFLPNGFKGLNGAQLIAPLFIM